MHEPLHIIDSSIIVIYFIVVLAIGLYYSGSKSNSAEDYFLAGRSMGWIAIGFSLLATNISSEHIIGLATAGSKSGFAVGHFEWLAIIFILVLGWIFTPYFLKSKVNTIPELIGKKYGDGVRKFYSGLSIFTYIFTKIAISLLAGGILLNEVFGWDFVTSITLMLLFTGIYTITGGLRSVMRVQIFQAVLFIIGGIAVALFGINSVGGSGEFFAKLPDGYLEMIKPLSDPDFPWLGILLGAPILAAWYWWADQYIAQRLLSAKNIKEAKKGTLFGALLKTFPFLFLIVPGMIAFELSGGKMENGVYSILFSSHIFPVGIKGLIIVGFFAALMSSLASAFNSTATLIAYDFFNKKDEPTNDSQLILIGRLSTIFIVVVSIIFIPMLKFFDNGIYVNLQRLQAYISPPIVVIFLTALFWKRVSPKAAVWTLIIGETMGGLRIVADYFVLRLTNISGFLNYFHQINYLYFATFIFFFSLILFISLSFILEEEKNLTEIKKGEEFYFSETQK